MLSFLFIVDQIIEYYLQECYGEVFKNIHEYYMYFNSEKYIVKKHRDKKAIKTRLEKIKNSYVDRATTIDGFLNICFKEELIEEEIYCSIIEDDDYQLVKDVYIEEVRKLTNYLNDPKVSTQHGVKGESHDTVVFVADDSNNPAVHMSKFFEMWSDMNITLREFDAFYYRYSNMIKDIERTMGIKISELRAKSYAAVADMIDTVLKRFISENETNPYGYAPNYKLPEIFENNELDYNKYREAVIEGMRNSKFEKLFPETYTYEFKRNKLEYDTDGWNYNKMDYQEEDWICKKRGSYHCYYNQLDHYLSHLLSVIRKNSEMGNCQGIEPVRMELKQKIDSYCMAKKER